jgi:hypothetical protein
VRGFHHYEKPDCRISVLAAVLGQGEAQQGEPATKGVIYGAVISQNGEPVRGLTLTALPWGVAVNGGLFRTKTNDAGNYRFRKLPRWGKYVVYADDEKAGYSRSSTGPIGDSHVPEIEITAEHPEAEFNLSLPLKAAFVHIHLRNRITGSAIRQMTLWISPMEKPDKGLFRIDCDSDHVVLIPPDQNLLLHVKSDGYREWDESIGTGKPINAPSGGVLTLNVQLDPTE